MRNKKMQGEKNQPGLWRQSLELQPSQVMEQQFLGLQTSTKEPAKGPIFNHLLPGNAK